MFLKNIRYTIKHEADGGNGGAGAGGNGSGAGEGDGEGSKEGENGSGEGEKTFTQAEVDAMIAERSKRAADKAVKDLEEANKAKADEAKRMKNMTEQQKADLEKEKMQQRIDELEAKQVRSEMSSQARSKLAELEVTANDAVINLLVTDKAESTLKNVELYAEAVNAAVEERYQKDRTGKTPGKSSASGSNQTMSLGERLAKQQESANSANDPFAALERGKK